MEFSYIFFLFEEINESRYLIQIHIILYLILPEALKDLYSQSCNNCINDTIWATS